MHVKKSMCGMKTIMCLSNRSDRLDLVCNYETDLTVPSSQQEGFEVRHVSWEAIDEDGPDSTGG